MKICICTAYVVLFCIEVISRNEVLYFFYIHLQLKYFGVWLCPLISRLEGLYNAYWKLMGTITCEIWGPWELFCWGFKSSGMWQCGLGCVVAILLALLDPEAEGVAILRNVGNHSSDDTVSQPRKLECQCTAVDKMCANSALCSDLCMLIVCGTVHFMGGSTDKWWSENPDVYEEI